MINSRKESPSINNSSLHEPLHRSPIRKLRTKQKILRIQTFHSYKRGKIPRSDFEFPNLIQNQFLGVGNLEWFLWPMRKQKNSRSLFLNFAGDPMMKSNQMDDKTFWVPFLRLPLTSIKSLAKLRIDLTVCKQITNKTILLIFSRLKHIHSLEYLEVFLKQNEEITHSGIQQIASFAKNLRSLKGFYFGCPEASSTESGGFTMKTLREIYLFSAVHRGFKLDDKSLILISPAIRVMKSLAHLTLNLLYTNISDVGLIPLFKSLAHLDQLQCLTLILCRSKIGELGLVHLAQVLSNLHSLRRLAIDFGMCQQISEPGITSLMSSIQKMENLSDLTLSFMGCSRINDKTANEIALALKNMRGLKSLALNLEACNINNGQAVLEEAVRHIVNKRIRTGKV